MPIFNNKVSKNEKTLFIILYIYTYFFYWL